MIGSFEKAKSFRLGGSSSGWGEDFIQQLIAEDPTILGLGDLVVKERERRQRGAGRLDFLLQDSPPTKRYEVEIQLGDTDPSHIVRTIEYWDRERRNAPQYEHVAVIVAEGITARFFNVISLFNQHIPLIAIKMSALEVAGNRTLVFTKVLDYTPKTVEDEDAGIQETDRGYWEKKSSTATMALVDQITSIAKKIDPTIKPHFNKGSIPLKIGAEFWRFLTLWPKKKHLKMSLPCEQSDEIENKLTSADIDFEGYDELRKRYVLTLTSNNAPQNESLLEQLIKVTYHYGQNGSGEANEE